MIWQLIQIFLIISIFIITHGQANGVHQSIDPTNQELALLDWSSGIRIFYCTDASLEILVEPFKRALTQSLNKFCKNATACRLAKSPGNSLRGAKDEPKALILLIAFCPQSSVYAILAKYHLNRITLVELTCNRISFKSDYVVLLDGYPKVHYGAVQFRFVIVLPPNAVPLDYLRKPFLTREILSNFLNASIKEFERRFGWKVSSYERFPRFDPITEFMNVALIPIGFILLILMLLLAYWSSTISRSDASNEEWFVIGTTGGKSTAMKRTLEIIEEQKYTETNDEKEFCRNNLPKFSIQSVSETSEMEKHESDKDTATFTKEIAEPNNRKLSMEQSPLHLSIIRSESTSTIGSAFKNVGGRRVSRRLSSIEDGNFIIKRHRKKRIPSRTKRFTQRQFKLTSMALSGFGHSRKY
ncbi:Photosystem II reaction center Psb28 protein [Dirofilaria immitis]